MTPKILTLHNEQAEATAIDAACNVLKRGGVIVCATDTGYLLGGDGLNPEAIARVYEIKGRAFDKPIHLVAHLPI